MINNYCTDNITNAICQYYNEEIDNKETITKLLQNNSKEELAEYIVDSFNKNSLTSSYRILSFDYLDLMNLIKISTIHIRLLKQHHLMLMNQSTYHQ